MSQLKPLPSSITTALIKFEQEVRHATKHNTHENDLAADKACSKLMEAIRKELEASVTPKKGVHVMCQDGEVWLYPS